MSVSGTKPNPMQHVASRRAFLLRANAALRVDPVTRNTTLSGLTGASAVFYDTSVRVVKAREG